MPTYTIYTDGAYDWGTDIGGWAALIIHDGQRTRRSGHQRGTTNNRMELLAAIKALEEMPAGSEVALWSDSEYLIKDMQSRQPGARPRRRNKNLDMWRRLDELASQRKVRWEWVEGHTGHPDNEEANTLAEWEAGLRKEAPPAAAAIVAEHPPAPAEARPQEPVSGASGARSLPDATATALTHLDAQGRARMVDVGWKEETAREAVARGSVRMRAETLALIRQGGVEKGDVLAAARIAGAMGAKQTPHLIPLCHPIPLSQVSVELQLDEAESTIHITATARAVARTGVEMEAMMAVAIAALTIYDMCKSVDRAMRIEGIRLTEKRGGKSGEIILE
ncbi:MAG: cyclic pyranopterin monophosphate synthase MoaC [Chloroflexi bacterium]|nr:cyclic pyranopterin monophosphate synthase MoaC [Chloroflexota bacterium]